jgi:hypothetical protein
MIRLKLTPEQRADLQQLRRDRTLKPAERDRVELALLSDAGWAVPQIAEHLGYCAQTVRRVFAPWVRTGPAGLRHHKPGPAPDVPRRERVAAALEEAGIPLSTRQVRRYLTGPGLRARWRRTKRTLDHKADPERVAAARADLETLKNGLRPAS